MQTIERTLDRIERTAERAYQSGRLTTRVLRHVHVVLYCTIASAAIIASIADQSDVYVATVALLAIVAPWVTGALVDRHDETVRHAANAVLAARNRTIDDAVMSRLGELLADHNSSNLDEDVRWLANAAYTAHAAIQNGEFDDERRMQFVAAVYARYRDALVTLKMSQQREEEQRQALLSRLPSEAAKVLNL